MRSRLRVLPIVGISLILLALTGCWDNRDINHRSLPIVMGISKVDERYHIVLQIPEPNQQQGTEFRLIKETGATINEIVDRIGANMETQVDLLHLKVILFDKAFATSGLNDAVSAFIRSHEISPKTMAVICDEPIDQFFDNTQQNSKNNGTLIEDFFKVNAGWSPQVATSRVWELFRSIHSYTRDESIPIIMSGKGTIIETRGSAIIRNGKMVGRLTSNETLLTNIFSGLDVKGKIEVMDSATVQIVSNRITNRSSIVNGKPMLRSKIKLRVALLETKGRPTQDEIKKELQATLSERFNRILAMMKEEEADILGIGQLFRNKLDRDELRMWRVNYLPNLKADIHFEVYIDDEGDLKMDA